MSVYIKIKDASLNKRPSLPIYLLIESSSATLRTIETPSSNNPFWQRYLHFRICLHNNSNSRIPTSSFFQQLKQNNTYAVGQLPFHYFQSNPGQQIPLKLELVSQKDNQFKKQGYLQLIVYYQPNKNYIGEMEFFQFGNILPNKKYQKNNKNDHIVGSNNNQSINIFGSMSGGRKPYSGKNSKASYNSKVEMYKGPCKTKNLFSCCDRPVNQQEYQLIQPHYFNP